MGGPRNILLRVSFDGTAFHGWQQQPGLRTVEGILQAAVETIVQHPVRLWGSSRTDVGVHARTMPVNFETSRTQIPLHGFLRGLNTMLPDDIGVLSVEDVPRRFRARYESVAKTYTYRFLLGYGRRPLEARTAWWIKRRSLDAAAMHAAAQLFVGEHDFSAFRSSRCDAKSTVRRIYHIGVSGPDDGVITLQIVGNAFMRNMVRIIAGTLAEVGLEVRAPETIPALFASGDRTRAGLTAPSCGLTLTEVHFEGYPRLGKAPPPDEDTEDDLT